MSQASRSGRTSPLRRATSTGGTAGLLSSLRDTMSTHLRSATADAAGESPSGSLSSFQMVTGGGLGVGVAEASTAAARTLLGSFVPRTGPGSPDRWNSSTEEEEEIMFSNGGDIRFAFESLGISDDAGEGGEGVGLFFLTDAEAYCLGRVGTATGPGLRRCAKPIGECTAQSHQETRDADALEGLVGHAFVRSKTKGGAKAFHVDPKLPLSVLDNFGGAAELLNSTQTLDDWKLIFGELISSSDGGLAGTIAKMKAPVTPARVRFTGLDGDGLEAGAQMEFDQSVSASFLQLRAFLGIDRPLVDEEGHTVPVTAALRFMEDAVQAAMEKAGDAKTVAAEVKSAMTAMQQRFGLLVKEVKGQVDQLRVHAGAYASQASFDALRQDVDTFSGVLSDVVTAVTSGGGPIGGGPSAQAAGIGIAPNARTYEAMEARLSAQFTAMLEALENRVTSKAVQAGPESFGDSTEALLFVTNETVHGAFESWIGPITLMVSGEADISMLEQSLQQELTSHKTGNTIDQSAMIAAFKLGYSVPYILGGEVTKRTDNKPLADIPDWEAWAGAKGSGGKRSELTKLLVRLKSRHKSMIQLVQRGKPRAIALAISILDEAHNLWLALFNAVSTQYAFLVGTTHGDNPTKAEKDDGRQASGRTERE